MQSNPMMNPDEILRDLLENARFGDLPDRVFFKSFTARRRRELVYSVVSFTGGVGVELEVHGSGMMKAIMTMPCATIGDGLFEMQHCRQQVCWADTGAEAFIPTRLDHRHLEEYPCPRNVMQAFVDAIGLRTAASCPGGYAHWKAAMQLLTARIAREAGTAVEVVAALPLSQAATIDATIHVRRPTDFEIWDISDLESPTALEGHRHELRQLDAEMAPEAVDLLLLPPGCLVRRRHREIFHAG